MTLIIAGTGHRPHKLGGYEHGTLIKLKDRLVTYFKQQNPDQVITGMALGWDTAVALAAWELNIPFIAAVPFKSQDQYWTQDCKTMYRNLLDLAAEVHIISTGVQASWKYQVRNEWMVNRCDKLVAAWDGSKGGTANCIAYANRVGKPWENLFPFDVHPLQ